ncbi:MAG: type VI secretion system membrane subunit TssM [Gammaproteobacteria bacterium]
MNLHYILKMLTQPRAWVGLFTTVGIGALVWGLQQLGITVWWQKALVIIGLAALIWVSWLVYRTWLSKMGGKLFQAIQQQTTEEHQLEVAALREKMKEALGTLKTSGLNVGYRGQAALYALPWFMMIGPSAAGKSTLLRNSGLHFPYSRHKEIDIKGFAGTRNCDWWFADEAIILDTAGRYTTEEEDKPEWYAFLDMLKKFRGNAPINGVVVALSLSDVLKASPHEIEDHVHIIRARLQELIQRLGVIFPVQMVFTKCDLLEGFTAYFQDLSAESREQVWGIHLESPHYQEDAISLSFHRLYEKLCALRMHKLSLQSESESRAKVLSFPAEFKDALEKVKPFLELLLKSNPYQEQPDFKGIFFTSAHQDAQQKLSYFIKHLFKKIIFADKHLVKSQRAHKVNLSIKTVAAVGSALAIVTAIGLFQSSYDIHQRVYTRVENTLKTQLNNGAGFTRQKVQGLNALYDEYVRIDDLTRHKSMSLHAIEKMDLAKKVVLRDWMSQMQALFMNDVAKYLEIDLDNQAQTWFSLTQEQQNSVYASLYDHLKTYLMLSQPREHMERAYALPRLAEHWAFIMQNRYVELAIPQDRLTAMVGTYIDLIKTPEYAHYAWRGNPSVIGQARNILSVNPSPETIYAHMISDLNKQLGYTNLTKLMEGKSYGMFESQHELPNAYTKEHFSVHVLPALADAVDRALEGDWVLSNDEGVTVGKDVKQSLMAGIRGLYFTDYAEQWFAFLASVKVRSFQSIEDASNKLAFLQQQEGPLSALMSVVHDNVYLSENELLPTDNIKNEKVISALLVPELDGPFYALRRMTQPGEKMKVAESINQYLHLIGRVQSDLLMLSHSSNPGRDAESYARRVFAGSETELSKAASSLSFLLETSTTSTEALSYGEKTRKAMEPLLLSALEGSWHSVLNSAGLYLQQEWDAQVIDAYNHTLRNKFPFARTSVDATLEDVAIFFRPREGVLSEFQDTYLMPYLQWTRNGYVPQTWLGQSLAFSDDFIDSLTRAKRISEGLFRNNGSDVELTFFISPVPTPGIEEVIFDSNGQIYRYRNEPEEWRRFVWPGDSAEMGARLYVSKNDQAEWAEVHRPGVWGLFHLLNAAKLTREAGAQYLSQWNVKDAAGNAMNVRFKLRADKQNNIFEPGLMQQFALPEHILAVTPMRALAQYSEAEE